jgi:hypothetical protein
MEHSELLYSQNSNNRGAKVRMVAVAPSMSQMMMRRLMMQKRSMSQLYICQRKRYRMLVSYIVDDALLSNMFTSMCISVLSHQTVDFPINGFLSCWYMVVGEFINIFKGKREQE